jgi:hypothetical protein
MTEMRAQTQDTYRGEGPFPDCSRTISSWRSGDLLWPSSSAPPVRNPQLKE